MLKRDCDGDCSQAANGLLPAGSQIMGTKISASKMAASLVTEPTPPTANLADDAIQPDKPNDFMGIGETRNFVSLEEGEASITPGKY